MAGYKEKEIVNYIVDEMNLDITEGLSIYDGQNIDWTIFNRRVNSLILNICDKFTAARLRDRLLNFFYADTKINIINYNSKEIKIVEIKNIDGEKNFDESCAVFIRADLENKKDIYDLVEIVEILRSEDGCPWDKEQTHESIKNALVEESYEVKDAIEQNDKKGIVEELGDVLLQVVFHSVLGKESSEFYLNDVIEGVCDKMIYRHPHVFGDVVADDSETVLANWDKLKKKEKNQKSVTDELNGVAKALPALIRAAKVQKKAAKVGFDWDKTEEAAKKVAEELDEVLGVYKSENRARIQEEVGDLIFSCVNLSRFLKVDPEESLNLTTEKFIKRFNYIEVAADKKGINLNDMTLAEMDYLWEESKKLEN